MTTPRAKIIVTIDSDDISGGGGKKLP